MNKPRPKDSANALLAAAALYSGLHARVGMPVEELEIKAAFKSETSRSWYNAVLTKANGMTKAKPRELLKSLRNIIACELVALRGRWHECKADGVVWIPLLFAQRSAADDTAFFEVLGEALNTNREPTFTAVEACLIANWDDWDPDFSALKDIPPLKYFTASAISDFVALVVGESTEISGDDNVRTTFKRKLGLRQELPARVRRVRKRKQGLVFDKVGK